jgi:hypothetical protein
MSGGPTTQAGEFRLDPESIEAIARRFAELVAEAEPRPSRKPLISAEEVSKWWGMSRRWVYENANRLGARRLGTGRRPRLRFDPDEVAEQLGEPSGRSGTPPDARRLPAISGDCGPDSLSTHGRAIVVRQATKWPGRRCNPPRPGAEGGPSAR